MSKKGFFIHQFELGPGDTNMYPEWLKRVQSVQPK